MEREGKYLYSFNRVNGAGTFPCPPGPVLSTKLYENASSGTRLGVHRRTTWNPASPRAVWLLAVQPWRVPVWNCLGSSGMIPLFLTQNRQLQAEDPLLSVNSEFCCPQSSRSSLEHMLSWFGAAVKDSGAVLDPRPQQQCFSLPLLMTYGNWQSVSPSSDSV